MITFFIYLYKLKKHAVLFNGEISELQMFGAMEVMLYLVGLLAFLIT